MNSRLQSIYYDGHSFVLAANEDSIENPQAPLSTRMVGRWSNDQQSFWNGRLADAIWSAFRFDNASEIAAKTNDTYYLL